MADFPRIRWLNIDGQQVPFTEPQHFTGNGDETVRTGHDNPLPVANYTQKGNIWLPVSEENPVPTQLTGSNVEKQLAIGAITSIRTGQAIRGIQIDGSGTGTEKMQPDEEITLADYNGSGEGVFLRVVSEEITHESGARIEVDGNVILGVTSGMIPSNPGRWLSFKAFDTLGATSKGDKLAFGRVAKWESSVYVIEYDLTNITTFKDSFNIKLINDTDEEIGMSAYLIYKVIE